MKMGERMGVPDSRDGNARPFPFFFGSPRVSLNTYFLLRKAGIEYTYTRDAQAGCSSTVTHEGGRYQYLLTPRVVAHHHPGWFLTIMSLGALEDVNGTMSR